MSVASEVATILLQKGFQDVRPWSGQFGMKERIYYGRGYVELVGTFPGKPVDLDETSDFVKACKEAYNQWHEARIKQVEELQKQFPDPVDELPF